MAVGGLCHGRRCLRAGRRPSAGDDRHPDPLIDSAQGDRSADNFLPRAQDMLLAIHRLSASLTHRDARAASIRAELRLMCNDWIKSARFC